MKYRKLGNTGLIVSEVALGTMQFGGKMNMGNLGQEDTARMVKLALDRGINFIDTADVYSLGESETLVGNALRGVRQEIVLATKVRLPMSENLNRSGATRVNIMREVEDSLQRLQTDYIDLYQVHGWDSNTPLEETLRTLDDIVRQGKVRYVGLSNLMSWQAATAIMLQERLGLETSESWFGARWPAVSFRASTAVPTLLLPARDSRRLVPSCPSTKRWATASWKR
jgi:aryl-alcohol dehydrogenase-like predicted oxidoreductase